MKRIPFKKVVIVILLAACFSGLMSSCGLKRGLIQKGSESELNNSVGVDPDGVKIGYSVSSFDESFAAMVMQRVKLAFSQTHPEWQLLIKNSDYNANIEYQNTMELIKAGCDIIMYHAVDTYGSITSVEACNDAGIPCITMVNIVNDGTRIYVGAKNYECGQMIADYIRDKIPKNGTVCILMGPAGTTNSEDRVNGFKDNLNRDDVVILDEQCGDWIMAMGRSIMTKWLNTYERIDLVFSCSDTMTPGAVAALKAADRLDETMVTSVDCSYEGLACLKDGEYECDMFYNTITIAEFAIDACERLLAGETEISDYNFSFELITRERAQDTIDWYFEDIEDPAGA